MDYVSIGLVIGMTAFGSTTVAALLWTLAARGHHIGHLGHKIASAGGFVSLSIAIAAGGLSSPRLVPVLSGAIGAIALGACIGLLLSEAIRIGKSHQR